MVTICSHMQHPCTREGLITVDNVEDVQFMGQWVWLQLNLHMLR